MTSTTLFSKVFGEELISRGFKRKAKLYYRLHGDILQGIVIKPINPYSLHFAAYPYWMDHLLSDYAKGYWAESGIHISPDVFAYYRPENEQYNTDYMNVCFELAKMHVLPVLDEIKDLNSFIENLVPNWQVPEHQRYNNRVAEIRPVDINEKYSYMNPRSTVSMCWHTLTARYCYEAFLYRGYLEGDLQFGRELLRTTMVRAGFDIVDYQEKLYDEFIQDKDLSLIGEFFEERKKEKATCIHDKLKLDTSHLN